jgi:hypothetical protein
MVKNKSRWEDADQTIKFTLYGLVIKGLMYFIFTKKIIPNISS